MATSPARRVAAMSSEVDHSTPPSAGGNIPPDERHDIARIRPNVEQLSNQIHQLSGHGYDLERARRLVAILDHELALLAVGTGEASSLVHARNVAASIVVKLSQLLGHPEDPHLSAALACAEQIAEELSNVAHHLLVPSETIAYAVREDILAGRLSPGDRLIESDLSERFGVSRTSVHEALSQLQREGFVTLVRYRGATVSRFGAGWRCWPHNWPRRAMAARSRTNSPAWWSAPFPPVVGKRSMSCRCATPSFIP
jgi:DNA-binding transcriptional ArsR family regulator